MKQRQINVEEIDLWETIIRVEAVTARSFYLDSNLGFYVLLLTRSFT